MPKPGTWTSVQQRLRRLSVQDWSAPQESQSQEVKEQVHEALWREVMGPRILHVVETLNSEAFAIHRLVLGYRVTRLMALLGRCAGTMTLVQNIPMTKLWAPVTHEQGPLQGFTLPCVPSEEHEATFTEALKLLRPHLRFLPDSPMEHLFEWITGEGRLMAHWPSVPDLIMFEEGLLELTQDVIKQRGRVRAAELLRRRYCFGRLEAEAFVQTAIREYQAMGQVDLDTERGLALARAEDYYRRARKADNLQEEGKAIKLHAAIVGLTRNRPEDRAEEEQDLLTTLAKIKDPPKPAPELPGHNPNVPLPLNEEQEHDPAGPD